MLGLIKKDFLLIKANLKSMIIIFVIYIMLAFQGTLDATFIIPLIGIILFLSTFSYDDFNNWNSYAVTLPNGRKNVVRAKYIASPILMIILAVVAFSIGIGISYIKTNSINLDEIISSLMGTMLSIVIINSLLYPIVFKFGATNGRIILFAVVFGIAGIGTLIAQFIDMAPIINIINNNVESANGTSFNNVVLYNVNIGLNIKNINVIILYFKVIFNSAIKYIQ